MDKEELKKHIGIARAKELDKVIESLKPLEVDYILRGVEDKFMHPKITYNWLY